MGEGQREGKNVYIHALNIKFFIQFQNEVECFNLIHTTLKAKRLPYTLGIKTSNRLSYLLVNYWMLSGK